MKKTIDHFYVWIVFTVLNVQRVDIQCFDLPFSVKFYH